MKISGGVCLVGIFTMLTTLVFLITILISVNFIKAENSTTEIEESTKYEILRPDPIKYLELQNESSFDWENGFRDCGRPVQGCPTLANISEIEISSKNETNLNETVDDSSSVKPIPKPLTDFKEQPSLCRCDDKCVKYGDCCSSVLAKMKKIPEDNHWRCEKLLDSNHYVRMISKCPSEYPSTDVNKLLCESEDHACPHIESNSNYAPHYCPFLDVPVYNNRTGNLYKSLFCARCHNVYNHDIQAINHSIRCTTNLSDKKEWEEFTKRSVYRRGRLSWVDSENSSLQCKLEIEQLQPNEIKNVVPDVRFCLSAAKEECELDLSEEKNLITSSLCFSYTLVVAIQKGKHTVYYKNPHCAKCEDPDIDIRKDPKCYRTNPRDRGAFSIPALGTRMLGGETGPVGINILFHFSLDIDDGYVGYTSKCEEDEILDFIRNKCVPVICPKGYELVDGQCEKIDFDNQLEDESNDTSILTPRDTNSSNSSIFSNSSSEPCFLIIFHHGEYRQLQNGSLAVNKTGSAGGVLVFQPGEYQKYDGDETNMSMSICAKHVENTYESSFAPALSYISNFLLILSVLCSLIHVVLYIILPKMRNLPGNNLVCLTTCLLISHFIFLTFINTSNHTVCVVASITMHYFLLSGFAWMYVMSFDIWRTFSSEFLIRRHSGDSTRTFIKYSLFSWTLPLLIVILAAITDFALPDSWLMDAEFGPVMKKLRPLYGHNNLCWIGQRLSLFVFFAFPAGLIIICNLILFGLTAFTIWAQNKEGNKFINGTGSAPANSGNKVVNGTKGPNKIPLQSRNSGSTKKSDKIRFKLYAKLALIMGLTWILGLLSGLTNWQWLWYPFVIFNGLQGTFIFVAFDCKRKVWNMVKDECGWTKRKLRKRDTGEGSSDTGNHRIATTTLSSSLGNTLEKPKENMRSSDNVTL